ncbi:DUF1345 domain-containing protein [Microbacterium sp. RURRCA19A]|uniref:DUF1345 domain-containing protein n=1 Tax=Microbacterium sp. RURRCA19A TaxID=1907391 RepID=UPI000955187A|nr:DUF1345 domain-containing protein [Microbacterium sp. RURRCA19A]SIR95627.1 Uncharacterized membrane protein [Microbacterium sp. RURRCA19A]
MSGLAVPRRFSPGDVAVTVVEAAIVALAVAYAITGTTIALLVWEGVALTYLVVGFVVTRCASLRERSHSGRTGLLDTLSWVLPLVSSVVGVSAAVSVLIARESGGAGLWQVAVGAVGIILSWVLLQTGFARVYEATQARHGDGLRFSRTGAPDFGDFLYFSFGLGTFAHSDAEVRTRDVRWIVLVHSVVSFLYNALVVAVAIEVLQQIVVRD